ncbi:MAG: hypothetical protein EOO75_09135 [Myxococcales bacterium]|nr:MAG: hypothetical protein EOO75_09135 [Myxococcales bacterium]
MTAAQTLASRLLLAIGAVALVACSDDPDTASSTKNCTPPVDEKCVALDVAWGAARNGAGGESTDVPAECPALADIQDRTTFIDKLALSGSLLTGARTEGELCCYKATYACEGRPLVAPGALRTARLHRQTTWG